MNTAVATGEPGRYQMLPRLTDDEYIELRHDIEANGVRVPIDVDEHGEILDGHHRARIAEALHVMCPRRVLPDLSETEKRAHALAVNVHRRSLSQAQRRDLIAASVKADPDVSDREHARRTGASDKTVTSIRRDLESTAEIPQLDRTTGSDGKSRPASRPAEPDPIEQAVSRYPALDAYRDQPERIATLAGALDGYSDEERPIRLDALAKHAAAKREGRLPQLQVKDDRADAIFRHVNAAARLLLGHEDAVIQAVDPVIADTWREQYQRTGQALLDLAARMKNPNLRSVR